MVQRHERQTGGVTFTGNLCYDDYGCIMAFDGTSDNTITDNACFDMERTACINLYSDTGSVINHNAQQTGGADPAGLCDRRTSPTSPAQFALLDKRQQERRRTPSGETYTNNIDHSGRTSRSGSLSTNTNNMWSGRELAEHQRDRHLHRRHATRRPGPGSSSPPDRPARLAAATGSTSASAPAPADHPPAAAPRPSNTTAPALSGTAAQGNTLTTTNGTWTITGNIPTATTYQWFDCPTSTFSTRSCTPIQPQTAPTSANGPTYTLQSSDVGDYIFSEVTITNANGQINAISNPTGPIAS